ncbi:tetratricopeptide repeat protein [Allorhizobium sp. BGMRC 0089]|uniref:tetratricopeptide repeat protein n=1 Tax=Allorhizobium sonneratiae TaxID=2934936 RepID=UPI002033A1A2|nr:tetratricopeptide repeat protein [Allorhizobium sonneratiae]MCM2291151.1 tetratricopeptide repeat protein [Allorhizobium sonneratiae]
MAEDHESFIREVNDELRSEQVQRAWRKLGPILIGVAVLIVAATAGYRLYEYWGSGQSSKTGDQFMAALKLASDGKSDEAMKSLETIEKSGYGDYPVLARFRAASIMAEKGDAKGAIAAFDAIAADSAAPQVIRDTAKVRAAFLLVDNGSYDQVAAEVETLAKSTTDMLRSSAREALGLAAYKAGKMDQARQWFQQIADDGQAPRNVASRAQIMLDNIAAAGKTS